MFYSDKTAMLGVVTTERPCVQFFFVDEVCSLMKSEWFRKMLSRFYFM